MILGISGSGRTDGIISNAVQKILEESEMEYEYISLAGKTVQGCIGLYDVLPKGWIIKWIYKHV